MYVYTVVLYVVLPRGCYCPAYILLYIYIYTAASVAPHTEWCRPAYWCTAINALFVLVRRIGFKCFPAYTYTHINRYWMLCPAYDWGMPCFLEQRRWVMPLSSASEPASPLTDWLVFPRAPWQTFLVLAVHIFTCVTLLLGYHCCVPGIYILYVVYRRVYICVYTL